MTDTQTLDLSALTDDGDTMELDDGRVLRVRVEGEQEPIQTFWSDDCYGAISEYAYDYVHDGETKRPEGFTGNAEKLQVDRGLWIWWEPPKDGPKRGTPEFMEQRRWVRTLAESGFLYVRLELLDGTDAYGRAIVVDVASLGGIDSLDNGYLAEVVRELADELGLS